MKVVILAGGFGTRISEESHLKPKPMIEVGEKPILWHIMKIYSHYGFNDFIICLGYKGYCIKEYFAHYFLHESDVTFDFTNNERIIHHHTAEPWKVTLVDTGYETMTGGRLKHIQPYVGNEAFMLTYGDGLADIDIPKLLAFHKAHGKTATVTGVSAVARFGELGVDGDKVVSFMEKPESSAGSLISGGFFVLEPQIFDYLTEDPECDLEYGAMEVLAKEGQLMMYRHDGFWSCMDTLRDVEALNKMWDEGERGKRKIGSFLPPLGPGKHTVRVTLTELGKSCRPASSK